MWLSIRGPDPEELSHAPTSQVPRIHDSCHSGAQCGARMKISQVVTMSREREARMKISHISICEIFIRGSSSIHKSTLDHQSTLGNRPPVDIQPRTEPSTWMSAIIQPR